MLMLLPHAALRTLGREGLYVNPHGKARVAVFAARTVGVMAAAAKTGLHQFPVSLRIDQMLRSNDLGTSQFTGQITARIRIGGMKFKRRYLQLFAPRTNKVPFSARFDSRDQGIEFLTEFRSGNFPRTQ